MRVKKAFDCVEMKNAIHARLSAEMRGLTDEQERALIQRALQTSDSSLARLWRKTVTSARG